MENEIYSDQKPKIKTKGDPKLVLIIIEIVASVSVILFVLAAKLLGGNFYVELKKLYTDAFEQHTSVDEVLGDEAVLFKYSEENLTLPVALAMGSISPEVINELIWPVDGEITSGYGYRVHPISGEYLMHKGTDIAEDKGTGIKSALDGIVKEIDYNNSYGNYIIISHGGGFETLYAHCEEIYSTVGEEVKQGDIVAAVGSTGRSTGPHVHFEIRISGETIDPEWLLIP